MIVSRSAFEGILAKLAVVSHLAADTETYGLRPFHGDRLFSLILATESEGEIQAFYFNFQAAPDIEPENVLLPEHLTALKERLFSDPTKTWYLHNAKFDLHMLAMEGIILAGKIHCTQAAARLENNEHFEYSLAACAERIGQKKDDAVEEYITKHGLWEWAEIPGKKPKSKKLKHFDRVPFSIIAPYGEQDAIVTHRLARHQEKALAELARLTPGTRTVANLLENEQELTRTIFEMEQVGVKIDVPYCREAQAYEADRMTKSLSAFERDAGVAFKASPKLFSEIFKEEKDLWSYTDKGNPSFDSDTLGRFKNPAAQHILDFRDAKSRSDFYLGFLYHADADHRVHPNMGADGTKTGRFSSYDPNFQNLTSEDVLKCQACGKGFEEVVESCLKCGSSDLKAPPYLVRRALVPSPGFIFIMPDYDQMEYRMMFDYACREVGYETNIVKAIKAGLDPHQAMADTVTATGHPLTRSRAKNANFAKLYGSGIKTFAWTAGCTERDARGIMHAIDQAAPEIETFVSNVMRTAQTRRYIFNWAGRQYVFPNPRWAYRGPNYLIQGGCADTMKYAMNYINHLLKGNKFKSRMVVTVHDELLIECWHTEVALAPGMVKEIMESIFPWKYLPLTAAMEWSEKSFADKIKGMPA